MGLKRFELHPRMLAPTLAGGLRPNGYECYSCTDTFIAIVYGLYYNGLELSCPAEAGRPSITVR
jgi:hypothetical protein